MNVGKLIELLGLFDPDEPVVVQFLLAEHTDYSAEEFEAIADYLEDSDSFGDETARVLKDWCREALDCVEQDGVGRND
jgi:hypothetical protein